MTGRAGARWIAVLGCGGTIGTTRGDGMMLEQRHGAQLLATASGEPPPGVELRSTDVMRVSSRGMSPQDMLILAAAVDQAVADGADGVVVLHGTDTLEETAYALALLVRPSVPLVLTGAMRGGGDAGSDGPANVHAAIVAASSPELHGASPVVVFADAVHDPRWVAKGHTSRVDAFVSAETGPIGSVTEGRLRLATVPPPKWIGRPASLDHEVDLVWMAAGSSDRQLAAALEGADGIVIAGTGGGHVPPWLSPIVAECVSKMPVILASRCGSGPVLASTYSGPGSESDLLAQGVVSAGRLSPLKARIHLIVAMSLGMDVRDAFSAA